MASIISAGTTSGTSLNLSGDTSGVLQLATNGSTTAVTIDTSQNVGIGTASPSTRLAVAGNQVNFGTNPFIALSNAVGTTPTYIQQQNTSTGTLTVLTSGTGSNGNIAVQVGTGSTNALNVLSNGTTQFSTSISVGNATPTTSGAGISFPATQSASSDANTLDDYEEGTFTPTVNTGFTGITYTQQFGKYTKIGNVVNFQIRIQFSGTGNGVGLNVSGLPFASFNGSPNGGAYSTYFDAIAADAVWYVAGNATNIESYVNGSTTQPSTSGTVTNKFIIIAGQYFSNV